jgi:hypothetical protein
MSKIDSSTKLTLGVTLLAAVIGSPLIVELLNKDPAPKNDEESSLSVSVSTVPPEFTARFVYPKDEVRRTEFDFEKDQEFSEKEASALLDVTRVAFGNIDRPGQVFQVTARIFNAKPSPIMLNVKPTYFSLEDNLGRRASMISFCCSANAEVLASNEGRDVQMFFQSPGWHGKGVAAQAIFFRANGFLPIVKATWQLPTLPTAP